MGHARATRVVPAEAAAQRDPGPRQPEVLGVEVHRLQRLLLGPDHRLHPDQAVPPGKLHPVGELVLPLRLAHHRRHGPNTCPNPAPNANKRVTSR